MAVLGVRCGQWQREQRASARNHSPQEDAVKGTEG